MAKGPIERDRKRLAKSLKDDVRQASGERRPGGRNKARGGAADVLARTVADADARLMFAEAPELGVESMQLLHRRLWAALVELPRANKVHTIELTKRINDIVASGGDLEIADQLRQKVIRLQTQTVEGLKDIGVLIATLCKVYLSSELDKAYSEIKVSTDSWRTAMTTTNPPPPPPLDDDEPMKH